MNKSPIIQYGFFNALVAAGYVGLIALLLTNSRQIFGPGNNTAAAIAFLMTFVLSAAIMGITIFGRPVLWYLEGKKKEAILLVFYTIGFLFAITLVIFLFLLIKK